MKIPETIEVNVSEFVADFQTVIADSQGCEGYYQPNAFEKMIIEEAIMGLLEDDDFLNRIVEWKSVLNSKINEPSSDIHE